MKRASFALLGVLALAGAAGCRSSIHDDPILKLSAAESLAEGKRLIAAEKYSRARPYLTHAFEIEPNSASGREALLLVADALFLEGGETNWIQAEGKYRDFQNRFPTSDRSAYVQFQIASALARRVERSDRDQSATLKAVTAYEDLLRLYPTSQHVDEARTALELVRSSLAEHEFVVGRFYLRYGIPGACARRLEGLLDRFPTYAERDKALFHLALAYRKLQRADDAQATFARLRDEFPGSRWIEKIPKGS
ncbi:MAG: outer membrane protein assembly factor BamD [Myxococcota bacterium]